MSVLPSFFLSLKPLEHRPQVSTNKNQLSICPYASLPVQLLFIYMTEAPNLTPDLFKDVHLSRYREKVKPNQITERRRLCRSFLFSSRYISDFWADTRMLSPSHILNDDTNMTPDWGCFSSLSLSSLSTLSLSSWDNSSKWDSLSLSVYCLQHLFVSSLISLSLCLCPSHHWSRDWHRMQDQDSRASRDNCYVVMHSSKHYYNWSSRNKCAATSWKVCQIIVVSSWNI